MLTKLMLIASMRFVYNVDFISKTYYVFSCIRSSYNFLSIASCEIALDLEKFACWFCLVYSNYSICVLLQPVVFI